MSQAPPYPALATLLALLTACAAGCVAEDGAGGFDAATSMGQLPDATSFPPDAFAPDAAWDMDAKPTEVVADVGPEDARVVDGAVERDSARVGPSCGTGETDASTPSWCGRVLFEPERLLDLGHGAQVQQMVLSSTRLASIDELGRWILWNLETGSRVAQGELPAAAAEAPSERRLMTLQGGLLTVHRGAELELTDAESGCLLSIVSLSSDRYGIARDGSYVWTASDSDLKVWSRSGASLLTHPGNYRAADIYGDTNALHIALGPQGAQIIETIDIASGASTNSPLFEGVFDNWFTDSPRFIATNGVTEAVVYSSSVTELKRVTIQMEPNPWRNPFFGVGKYFWVFLQSQGWPRIHVYALDAPSNAPVLVSLVNSTVTSVGGPYPVAGTPPIYPTETIDLSGETPVVHVTRWPSQTAIGYPQVADERGNLVVGGRGGRIVYLRPDALGELAQVRTFGCGRVQSLDLAPDGSWAVALGAGEIVTGELTSRGVSRMLPFDGQKVRVADRGTKLISMSGGKLSIYDRASGELLRELQSTSELTIVNFDVAGDRLAVARATPGANFSSLSVEKLDSPDVLYTIPSESYYSHVQVSLSPSGRRLALATPTSVGGGLAYTSTIYADGTSEASWSGSAFGWLGEDRLFVEVVGEHSINSMISTVTGENVATVPNLVTSFEQGLRSGTHVLVSTASPAFAIYEVATGALVVSDDPSQAYHYGGVGPRVANDSDILYATGSYVRTRRW